MNAWLSVCHAEMVSLWKLKKLRKKLQAKDVLPNTNCSQAAERAENAVFVPGDLDLWPLTLTLKLVRARDQTFLPCEFGEFGANPFSGPGDISYTNRKKQTDGAKNRTVRSSLRAVLTKPYPNSITLSSYRTSSRAGSRAGLQTASDLQASWTA